ncbi:MAG: JAB domain-containing protein [Planctomycetes bacterium]|nr:JAB domain-containing protein [Planctomycetota bacterium]
MEHPGEYSPESLAYEYIKRNRTKEKIPCIRFPVDAYTILKRYSTRKQEHFLAITLNTAYAVIKTHVISKGIVDKTIIHAREIFRAAIKDNATAVLLAHNHPSGKLDPSHEDRVITQNLKGTGKLLGIHVLDHIILTKDSYYSFLEDGEL